MLVFFLVTLRTLVARSSLPGVAYLSIAGGGDSSCQVILRGHVAQRYAIYKAHPEV